MGHLMHLPTPLLLQKFSFDDLLRLFGETTGTQPSGVVYEVCSGVGPNFPTNLYRDSLVTGDNDKSSLSAVSALCKDHGLDLWLSFNTSMAFAASNATHIVDSQGDSSRRCCINARGTQRILRLLAEEAKAMLATDSGDRLPAGVVLSAQDLWPMGASGNVIEVSCFCRYCANHYLKNGLDRLEEFAFYPSPLNLALRDTGTGIDHINAFTSQTSAETLVEYSRADQMLAAEWLEGLKVFEAPSEHPMWDELRKKADRLLQFVRLREQVALSALETIASQLKETFPSASVACVIEGLDYEWTGGYFLDRIAAHDWYSEIWLPPNASHRLPGKPKRLYCAHRSLYVVGEFVHHLESMLASFRHSTSASENEPAAIRQTKRIGRMLRSFVMSNPGDYQAIDGEETDVTGFVTPLFVETTIAKLLELLPAVKSSAEELLDMMRAANAASEQD